MRRAKRIYEGSHISQLLNRIREHPPYLADSVVNLMRTSVVPSKIEESARPSRGLNSTFQPTDPLS